MRRFPSCAIRFVSSTSRHTLNFAKISTTIAEIHQRSCISCSSTTVRNRRDYRDFWFAGNLKLSTKSLNDIIFRASRIVFACHLRLISLLFWLLFRVPCFPQNFYSRIFVKYLCYCENYEFWMSMTKKYLFRIRTSR